MKREAILRRRLRTLQALSDTVGAMKSLAALHFRSARARVPTARDYRQQLDIALQQVAFGRHASDDATSARRGSSQPSVERGIFAQGVPSSAPSGLLLVAADLGLCRDYNSRLAQAAAAERDRLGAGPLYCIGRRPKASLARRGLSADKIYNAPTSVAGLTDLLLQVAEDLLGELSSQRISSLDVVSARFDGAGRFTPVCARVLPIEPAGSPAEVPSKSPVRHVRTSRRYVSPQRLIAVATREFVFITLYCVLLEGLAAEHGARLVAADAAQKWLDSRINETHRSLISLRRESATQEVLDVASGAKAARRRKSGPSHD